MLPLVFKQGGYYVYDWEKDRCCVSIVYCILEF